MPSRNEIVAAARAWLGTPYRHQGALKGAGCDCLGLLRGIYAQFYDAGDLPLPDYSPDWAEERRRERLLDALTRYLQPAARHDFQAGDVLAFRWRKDLPAKHVGLAAGRDAMIHVHEGIGVVEVAIVPQWRRRIAAVFSFPGIDD